MSDLNQKPFSRRLIGRLPASMQRSFSYAKRRLLGQPLADAPALTPAQSAQLAFLSAEKDKKLCLAQKEQAAQTRYQQAAGALACARKVSVIVPNYNYERFLDQRIDSILAQTYPIHELILLDDASTDGSAELLRRRAAAITKFPVRVVLNEQNSGCVFAQWEKGVALSTGDFFWIAEADDFCAPEFLATAMQPFADDKVLLSYTESSIVNEKGEVTLAHSREMFNIFGTDRWENAFISDGKAEICNYLSVNNTILNASSLVWRKRDYIWIFDEARSFRLAGDWYFYLNVLLEGDLAYSPQPLNFYRMHSGVVRQTTTADTEYAEICRIQTLAAQRLSLSLGVLREQRRRREYLGELGPDIRKKRVAFVSSPPFAGSGGHRTIIQNINALVLAGYDCDLYFDYCLELAGCTEENIRAYAEACCGECGAEIFTGKALRRSYDLVVATVWDSAKDVAAADCPRKAYFIQDYEPWFYPMGDLPLAAERSYHYGLSPITIGRWLAQKIGSCSGLPAQHFDFCADLDIYHPLPGTTRRNAVCAIYQPDKPRRCSRLMKDTLRRVHELSPETEILLYGSAVCDNAEQEVPGCKNLHILPPKELNRLYNSCLVGFCISSSNPSRIPFEMMAAGLPVVELDVENNRYDFPADIVSMAVPDPEALAQAICQLLACPDEQARRGCAGAAYMQDYPLKKGFDQFVEAVDHLLCTAAD